MGWSWAGQNSSIEWLDAVILPEWCELRVELSAKSLGANCTLEHQDSRSIQCCSLLARVSTFSAILDTRLVFPEIISTTGAGCGPTPLIKMFDSHGQWCGRLFHRSPDIVSNPDPEKLGLLLLSTSKPCKVAIKAAPGSSIME
jgi:hypothetical protein